MARTYLTSVRVILTLLTAFAMPTSVGLAWCGRPGCCLVDDNTLHNWAHTWRDPNDLEVPLNKYFIQRIPRTCGRDSYLNKVNCQDGVGYVNQYGALPYPPVAAAGFEPVRFERLGKIPNEMDRLGGVVSTVGPVVKQRQPVETLLMPK